MLQTKLHPEWRILYDAYKDSEYGMKIGHEELEQLIGFTREDNPEKYYASVNRWKKEMLEKDNRQIECINNIGYEIINPELFRMSANRQLKFGHKRINKAGKIITNAPVDKLNEDDRKKLTETGAIIAQILHFSKATMRKVKEIDKKTDQLLLDVGKALDIAD
jgi:hypothetical protein